MSACVNTNRVLPVVEIKPTAMTHTDNLSIRGERAAVECASSNYYRLAVLCTLCEFGIHNEQVRKTTTTTGSNKRHEEEEKEKT